MLGKLLKISILIFLATSCTSDLEVTDPTPRVWYKGFNSQGFTLEIGFEDGDGHLGFYDNEGIVDTITLRKLGWLNLDTIDTIRNNVFLDFYEIHNGKRLRTDSIYRPDRGFQIDFIEPFKGNYKTQKGVIELDLFYSYFYLHPDPADSFYIKFQIIDRTLRLSNIDSTPRLAWPEINYSGNGSF